VHELGLMLSALDIATTHARRAGATRIHRLRLRVGVQSGVVVEALEMAFAVAAPGTLAAGADLVVERSPVLCRCDHCERDFHPNDAIYVCPACGAVSAHVLQGDELELSALEVS
jgi:hydrogenase nickel incorporation protein HypA/HybF